MSMQEVFCQDCGRKSEVNLYYFEAGLANGDYVKGQRMVKFKNWSGDIVDQFIDGVFDVCKVCQAKNRISSGDPEILRQQRIQRKIALLRELRPDLDEDQRRAEAIREEFDPKREPNPAFRAWLLERELELAARSSEVDAAAQHALEGIQ